MATYRLRYYSNGWHELPRPHEGIDKARATACSLLDYLKTQGIRAMVIYIIDIKKPTYDYGQVWMKHDAYLYLPDSRGSEKGIIWKINPKTGKTISVFGYEE